MQVRLLGPVTVTTDGVAVDIAVQKQRALLAALALRSPGVVTTSELVDAVWGDDPPASADKTLQGYVSALRKSFGTELIRTVPGGYQLGSAVEQVDAVELEALVSAARQDLERGNPAAARRSFTTALALWSSEPLDDLAPGPGRDGQIARLHELHVLAAEGLVVAELQLGHHRDVVPDLERLVGEHPYRELLWQSSMLALYRSGRSADALHTYHRLRVALRDDLGIEPSEATRADCWSSSRSRHRILRTSCTAGRSCRPATTPICTHTATANSATTRSGSRRRSSPTISAARPT